MVGGGSAAAFTTMRKKEVVKNGCKSHTVRGERGSRRRLGTNFETTKR